MDRYWLLSNTCYGTWLPGDERGWLRKGEPAVQPPDPELEQACRAAMREDRVLLDAEQQQTHGEAARPNPMPRPPAPTLP